MDIVISKELTDFFENHNFSIESADREADGRMLLSISRSTPQGEDWHETFELGIGLYDDLINSIKQRAAYFDIDEEIEFFIENRGKYGIPSSVRAIVKDAEWKEEVLNNLASDICEEFMGKETQKAVLPDLSKDMDRSVMEWFCENYCYERAGEELAEISFEELYESIGSRPVEEILGVKDKSVIKRVVEQLSCITEMKIDCSKPLPELTSLGLNGRNLLPISVNSTESGYDIINHMAYVECLMERLDYSVLFDRAEFATKEYDSFEDAKKDYPYMYLDAYIKVYEDKSLDFDITLKEAYKDENGTPSRILNLTEREQERLLDVIEKDLKCQGKDLDDLLKKSVREHERKERTVER